METDLLLNQVQQMLSNMSNDIHNMAETACHHSDRVICAMDNLTVHSSAGDACSHGRSLRGSIQLKTYPIS